MIYRQWVMDILGFYFEMNIGNVVYSYEIFFKFNDNMKGIK